MKTTADMTARLSQPHTLPRSHKGFFIINESEHKVTDFVPFAQVPTGIPETAPLAPIVLGNKLKPKI